MTRSNCHPAHPSLPFCALFRTIWIPTRSLRRLARATSSDKAMACYTASREQIPSACLSLSLMHMYWKHPDFNPKHFDWLHGQLKNLYRASQPAKEVRMHESQAHESRQPAPEATFRHSVQTEQQLGLTLSDRERKAILSACEVSGLDMDSYYSWYQSKASISSQLADLCRPSLLEAVHCIDRSDYSSIDGKLPADRSCDRTAASRPLYPVCGPSDGAHSPSA